MKTEMVSYKGIVAVTGNVNELIKLTTYQNPYPEGEIGVLKKGAYADLLIIDGNPVEDLDLSSEVDHLRLIVTDCMNCHSVALMSSR